MIKKREGGFIALTSVLIIGAIVLILGISLFHSALTDYSISTAYESGQQAAFLADFCLKEGVLRLKENIDYRGGEEIKFNDMICSIGLVEDINGNTKKVSSLGRAGDQPHFSRSSRLIRYVIEPEEGGWTEGEELENLILGDFLRLNPSEEEVIARITDSSDEWTNSFYAENVEITEDGSLVLAVTGPPPPPPPEPEYTLSVNSSPVTGVFITSTTGHGSPPNTDYPKLVSAEISVSLTAPASYLWGGNSYIFLSWSGCVSSTNRTISFPMPPSNITCTAYYLQEDLPEPL